MPTKPDKCQQFADAEKKQQLEIIGVFQGVTGCHF